MHPTILSVTHAIEKRSATRRAQYLGTITQMRKRPAANTRMGCANLAHAAAALPQGQKTMYLIQDGAPAIRLGIVTAYNDMLSAHQPYGVYPRLMADEAQKIGAVTQVAGGVPAMCDGVVQGTPAMDMSLFSRDIIAQATAMSLSHDMFDAALYLGICDKIVPGLLIGALHFGHLPALFVPAGPMPSGLSNSEKAKVREKYAAGEVGRADLLAVEAAAYHAPGTCTFYGTANSNQFLLEAMGLHLPGAAFIAPNDPQREEYTRAAVRRAVALAQACRDGQAPGVGEMVDARTLVNAMVTLLATGGSTNHLIHWVAVGRAAGYNINWDDFSSLSAVVPLLAMIYPNGKADINQFQAAGGTQYVLRELLDGGFMHPDVRTVNAGGLRAATEGAPAKSRDETIVRPATQPFSATGGIRILTGNLGRSVIKVSAIPADRHIIEAPARVFESQSALHKAFAAGELIGDFVAVVRFQGPQQNGMPELHKLMPPLAHLQNQGARVALVTDGRLSGASGKVPAAIHLYPEARQGGPLARVKDGDIIRLDAIAGTLEVRCSAQELAHRAATSPPSFNGIDGSDEGYGRELFANARRYVTNAEEGACIW